MCPWRSSKLYLPRLILLRKMSYRLSMAILSQNPEIEATTRKISIFFSKYEYLAFFPPVSRTPS